MGKSNIFLDHQIICKYDLKDLNPLKSKTSQILITKSITDIFANPEIVIHACAISTVDFVFITHLSIFSGSISRNQIKIKK
jgi:hypothetical protein